MSSSLPAVVLLALCVTLIPFVSADSRDCQAYRDTFQTYQSSKKCWEGFCCGTCIKRYCCKDSFWRFSEDDQNDCEPVWSDDTPLPMIFGIGTLVTTLLIFVCCCVCPCCCLYKMCRKPRPVVATTTHTTVVTTAAQYPRQPTATVGQPQSYQGPQYPQYQSVPVQPGYGAQPMPQPYGAQPPFTAGPPPSYQEATGPCYPPNPMPYSQAAYAPGQPAYPLQPPAMPQPTVPQPAAPPAAPPAQPDYLAQPAYNPDYVAPPPKSG